MFLEKPLISIITPTYNAEKFIKKCIASVQAQDFACYEHIIIDGGSTDNTIGLLKKYAQGANNVKLVIEKDDGIYDAMNKGIKTASAEWIYFLGADDSLYSDDVLKGIAESISKNKVRIIYGNVYFERIQALYDGEFDIEKILTRNLSHQAVFYHVSVFQTMGLYDLRYRLHADYDINIRCWLSGRVDHLYIPLTIARFADLGASSMQIDERFVEDYPYKTVDALFAYKRALSRQISILSAIYRKIYLRYSFRLLIKLIRNKDHLAVSLAAITWMMFTSPFYILRSIWQSAFNERKFDQINPK